MAGRSVIIERPKVVSKCGLRWITNSLKKAPSFRGVKMSFPQSIPLIGDYFTTNPVVSKIKDADTISTVSSNSRWSACYTNTTVKKIFLVVIAVSLLIGLGLFIGNIFLQPNHDDLVASKICQEVAQVGQPYLQWVNTTANQEIISQRDEILTMLRTTKVVNETVVNAAQQSLNSLWNQLTNNTVISFSGYPYSRDYIVDQNGNLRFGKVFYNAVTQNLDTLLRGYEMYSDYSFTSMYDPNCQPEAYCLTLQRVREGAFAALEQMCKRLNVLEPVFDGKGGYTLQTFPIGEVIKDLATYRPVWPGNLTGV